MNKLLLAMAAILCVGCAEPDSKVKTPAPLSVRWEISEGLQSPESAYLDEPSGFLFVSNVGEGGATAKDGGGYISKLTPDGEMLEPKWVTGLNAPKGLRSHGGMLWVADIDRLVGIDIAKGEIRDTVEIEGAQFLNDVAVDATGAVYVSDMLGNKIHRYHNAQLTFVAEGERLESPNGLLVRGDRLIVAGWGSGIQDDFGTETPGRLFSLSLNGDAEKQPITPEPSANFDGIAALGDEAYVVSDWYAGKVYRITADGTMDLLLELPQGAADLGYLPEQRLLIVPQMLENKVTAFELPTGAP